MASGPTFSPRLCLICGLSFPPDHFGDHVLDHIEKERLEWPGGTGAWLRYLLESMDTSLDEAEGWPDVQGLLRAGRDNLREILDHYESLHR